MPANESPPINPPSARAVEVEVLPPEPPLLGAGQEAPPRGARSSPARPPIHPASALLLLVVDNLWNLADWAAFAWILTIPLSFLTVAIPTYFLQRRLLRQSRGQALAWAVGFGVIAAVPFSVGGTAIGASVLAWLGINRLSGRTVPS